jgi:hypothetical protein
MAVQDRHIDLQKCSQEFFGINDFNKEVVDLAEAFAAFVLDKRAQHERAEIDELLVQASLDLDHDQIAIDEPLTAAVLMQKVMLQRSLLDNPSPAADVLTALRTIDAHWNADAVDWQLLITDLEEMA